MLDSATDFIWALYAGFSGWSPPQVVMTTVVMFTAVSSFLLTGFTSGSRLFTMPISFILLFFAGLLANYLGRGVHFAGTTEMQTAIVWTAAGQMVAGFLLLLLFSAGGSKQGRR